MADVAKIEEAERILRANTSPRCRRLDRLERYVEGTQYEGRPPYWNDDYAVYDRAPSVVDPIVGNAIESISDFCLGEDRWPAITADTAENEEPGTSSPSKKAKELKSETNAPKLPRPAKKRKPAPYDKRFALSEEDAETLNTLIESISKQCYLPTVANEAMSNGMGHSTAVSIVAVRDGHLCVENVYAKWCVAEFEPQRPKRVTKLTIQYPYKQEFWNERDREWQVRVLLYRRVIDAVADTVFLPKQALETGEDPKGWTPDKTKTVEHGLGFCPVVWYPRRKRSRTVAEIDGNAIHAKQLDEIDALNYALSQKNAAAMTASSPPTIETGVDPDHNPAPLGPRPTTAFIEDGKDNPLNKQWVTGFSSPLARKRGPGVIWRYPNTESKVEQLTMAGDALAPVENDARELFAKISAALGYVHIDPTNAKFSSELSGKAIARLYDRQVRTCDKERQDFGDNWLLPVVDMLLRVALRVETRRPGSLRLSGLKEAAPVLLRFEAPVDAGGIEWFTPALDLTWGPYFVPDAADEKQTVDATIAAKDAGLITHYSAVEKLRSIFAIGNVDEYLEQLELEKQVKAEEEAEKLRTSMALMHENDDSAEPSGPTAVGVAKASPPGAPRNVAARGSTATPANGHR